MMKSVFVHLKNDENKGMYNRHYNFERIPVEGEYFALDVDGEWYKVQLVVHTPNSGEMCAEIYAVKVNHIEEIKKKQNN